ncbi:MAG: hypothetical protein VX764_02920 [Planctomycetota bacterium]|nr:hypothetical protein [Planctomycetota bacterium]
MGRVPRRVWPAIVLLPVATSIFLFMTILVVNFSPRVISVEALSTEISSESHPRLAAKEFIRGGTARGIYIPSGGWEPQGDVFVGKGRNKLALADHTMGQGNFDIEVKMSLAKVGANYSGIQFGKGRVVLGGDGGKIIFRGLPKDDHRVEICPLADYVEKDEPFLVRIRRRGSNLFLFVNGKRIHAEKGIGGGIGEFGLIAGDGATSVHFFRATGALESTGRKQRINREALKTLDKDERVTRSIEGGIDFILAKAQRDPDGILRSHFEATLGARALEAYALIVAGIDAKHPVIRSHLKACSDGMGGHGRIYDVSCWVFALDAAITQAEQDAILADPDIDDIQLLKEARDHRRDLDRAVEILISGHNDTGGWRYHHSSRDADLSVTQFAALAMGVIGRRQLKVPDDAWQKLALYCMSLQQVDGATVAPKIKLAPERITRSGSRRGGTSVDEEFDVQRPLTGSEMSTAKKRAFHYIDVKPKDGSWNMTCAGVSSLLIVYQFGGESLSPELREQIRISIRDGSAWLEADWKPHETYYGMYSLEKVGDLGNVTHFGEHDWYQEMSDHLLDVQQADGCWKLGKVGWDSDRLNTAFALLILKRASSLLTRGPRDVVIFTGGAEGSDDESDDWVVIPRTGESIHLPTLVRQLRLRPHPRMLGLLEEAVVALPTWKRPTVVPYLALVRERAVSRGVRKVIERCEEQVRPLGFEGPTEMEGWYRTWRRAREIGEDKLPEAGDELIGIARAAAGDPVLRETALRAALQLGLQKSARLMVEDLNSPHRDLRILAYQGIHSLFPDSPPPFDPDSKKDELEDQIRSISEWVQVRL